MRGMIAGRLGGMDRDPVGVDGDTADMAINTVPASTEVHSRVTLVAVTHLDQPGGDVVAVVTGTGGMHLTATDKGRGGAGRPGNAAAAGGIMAGGGRTTNINRHATGMAMAVIGKGPGIVTEHTGAAAWGEDIDGG